MLVYAVHGKTMEHIQRTHPLGVTLGQVIVDSNHMHALSGKCIQEYRKRGHKSLSFTCRHLGNFPLMKCDTTDNLHVVVHHIPHDFITACGPMIGVHGLVPVDFHKIVRHGQILVKIRSSNYYFLILLKSPCSGLDNRKGLRKNLVKTLLDSIILLFDEFVRLSGKSLFLLHWNILVQLILNLGNPFLERRLHIPHLLPQCSRMRTEIIVTETVYLRINSKHLVKNRLHRLVIAVSLGPEHLSDY